MTTGFPLSPLTASTFILVGMAQSRARQAPALHLRVGIRDNACDDRGGTGHRRAELCRQEGARAQNRPAGQRRWFRRGPDRRGRRPCPARSARRPDPRMPRRTHDRPRAVPPQFDSASGYDPLAEQRFRALLPETLPRGTRIISNLGAANPRMAGRLAIRIANELGLHCRVAVVTGDDVLDRIDPDTPALENGKPLSAHGPIISANAYLGADSLLEGLAAGADVVITGRVADPSLFVAPIDRPVRLEPGRQRLMASRHPGRTSPRVRNTSQRRLFRGSGSQGRAEPGHRRAALRRHLRLTEPSKSARSKAVAA